MKKYKRIRGGDDDIYLSPHPINFFCIVMIIIGLICVYVCPFNPIRLMFVLGIFFGFYLLFLNNFEAIE